MNTPLPLLISTPLLVILIILAVILVAFIVLLIIGRRMQKKQEAAINIVCINYTEAPLPEIRELCLGPDKGLLAFHAN